MTLWGKSVTGAPTLTNIPEPMTNSTKFSLPTLVIATQKEFTLASANFKEIQSLISVVTTWEESTATAMNFMDFLSITSVVTTTWKESTAIAMNFMDS